MVKKYKPPKTRKIQGKRWTITAGSRRGLPGRERFGTADLAQHKAYIKGLGFKIKCFKERDGWHYCWARKK